MEKLSGEIFSSTGRMLCTVICTVLLNFSNFAAPADLDLTFGNGGKVNTAIPVNGTSFISIKSMALQPDGKIVVAGTGRTSTTSQPDFFIARYNSNGTPDTNFGNGGQVFTDFNNWEDAVSAVAIQPDGKIVAVGNSNNSSSVNYDFAIVRYNSDGSLDSTFDGDGKLTTTFGFTSEGADAVKVSADGKILVAGRTFNTASFNGSVVILKFNSDGSPDASFGTAGSVTHDFDGQSEKVTGMAMQPDGRIVICGGIVISGSNELGYIARFETNGSLLSFYRRSFSEPTSIFSAVATRADGRIIAVGKIGTSFLGIELSPSGTVNGTLAVPSPNNGSYSSVAVQPNGKIVAAAIRNSQFTTVRYNTYDSFDSTFGTAGIADTQVVDNSFDEAKIVLIQPDGKILVGGNSYYNNRNSVSLVRYLGDFTAPAKTLFDYDGDRKSDISVFRPSNGTWYLNQSNAGFYGLRFGAATDKITPADYDGDGKTDISVFRDGTWFTIKSSDGTLSVNYFGQAGDIPVPNDYDGDNKADVAVYRNGIWYLNRSTAGFASIAFGNASDKTVSGDFDGDNKADIAVYRSGVWYYLQSSNSNFTAVSFGTATDKPVPADYDGDGKTDIAVYREGNWYLNRSTGGFGAISFGNSTDIPIPADYDGDGKADQAVFRDGNWYLLRSANGFAAQLFGFTTDKPTPSSFVQ